VAQKECWQRAAITFGLDGRDWNEELVLQRYELLYEASLIPEAARDKGGTAPQMPGHAMVADHRRILATGIARLRAKIKSPDHAGTPRGWACRGATTTGCREAAAGSCRCARDTCR
jgi:hypothetical protein